MVGHLIPSDRLLPAWCDTGTFLEFFQAHHRDDIVRKYIIISGDAIERRCDGSNSGLYVNIIVASHVPSALFHMVEGRADSSLYPSRNARYKE